MSQHSSPPMHASPLSATSPSSITSPHLSPHCLLVIAILKVVVSHARASSIARQLIFTSILHRLYTRTFHGSITSASSITSLPAELKLLSHTREPHQSHITSSLPPSLIDYTRKLFIVLSSNHDQSIDIKS